MNNSSKSYTFFDLNLPINDDFNATEFNNSNLSFLIQKQLLSNKSNNSTIKQAKYNEKTTPKNNSFKLQTNNFTTKPTNSDLNIENLIFYDSLMPPKDNLKYFSQKQNNEFRLASINNNRKTLIFYK